MYQVKFYQGDYDERQRQANADRCVGYVEHHFNSSPRASASYAAVVVGSNASATSRNWGRWYANAVAASFGVPKYEPDGIVVGGFDGRGDYNLRFTKMPAVLLEPLFASNPQHAEWIRSAEGQGTLASILVESIQRVFPDGGLVGFSVGHKYKKSKPNDRGALVAGGGVEADFAEAVLKKAEALLVKAAPARAARTLRVMSGESVLWSGEVDADATVAWDPVRGALLVRDG